MAERKPFNWTQLQQGKGPAAADPVEDAPKPKRKRTSKPKGEPKD